MERRKRRRLLALLAAAGVLAGPAAGRSMACTTSWSTGVSGGWNDAGMWSNGVPTASSDACVTVAGTYTVTIGANAAAGSLTLGAASGTQTLVVAAGGASGSLRLDVGSGGVSVGASGVLSLTTTDASSSLIETGTTALTNDGTINLGGGGGAGSIYLRAPVTNNGTTNVSSPAVSVDEAGRDFDNYGTLAVASSAAILFDGSGLDSTSGSIANSGSIRITTSYTQGNGTITGNTPLISGNIAYEGSGAGTVEAVGSGTLTGNVHAGQTLIIQGGDGFGPADWTGVMGGGIGNDGTITLETSDASPVVLDKGSFPNWMNNDGTLNLANGGGTGTIYLRTGIFNDDTTTVSAPVIVDETSRDFTNWGTLDITPTGSMLFTGSDLLNRGGSITNNGSIRVTSAYIQASGSVTGNSPVISNDVTYDGDGHSTLTAVGLGSIQGAPRGGQTLVIQGGGGFGSSDWNVVTAPWTNTGTITLTTTDASYAALDGEPIVLSNSGVVQSVAGGGSGALYLRSALTNNNILRLGAGTTITADSGDAISEGRKGVIETQIASATSFGALSIPSGTLSLQGTLLTTVLGGYKAPVGAAFPILSGTVAGQFAKLSKGIIDKKSARYYRPTYGPGVTLVVTNAAVAVSPSSGAPGSPITVTGSGWTAGEKVTVSFKAHDGTKTTLGSATANASGSFSLATSVPAGATPGSASIVGKGAFAKLSSAAAAFNVT
jgi:hypothetical protein